MSDDQEIPLCLRWRATWPDREADYSAEAPTYSDTVGRIYKETKPGSLDAHWFWAMNAFGPDISRNIGALSGHEDSPRAAARRVEEAWFLAIKGSRHESAMPPPPPRNAYAEAKGR